MTFNITHIEASSNGAWQGDNPLHYALPLLIIQISLVIFTSRSLALLLKPLRQPKVIAEILGGILLGPSALGRNKAYLDRIFPKWSEPILETIASIGLLFFLFLVGLELDLNSIRRSGRKAFSIAATGITLPFVSGIGVAFVLRETIRGEKNVGFAQFVVFMGVSLSITAFPVLARILAELKLLTTQVGETAMAAAAFNDIVAWVLLALAVALAGNGTEKPIISIWILLSGIAFVIFMLFVVKPVMSRIGKRYCSSSKYQQLDDEAYICLTLTGVIISGFLTDLIGVHSIFGAFVFGLTIPKEGEFAKRLIERIEDFVTGLLLPLYFASSGLKTDVAKIHGVESWGLLVLVITIACAGKILGTFFGAVMNKVPVREAITLGFLMNTKGLVELIVLNIGKEKKVLNDETFAILILMAIFATFITTPTVMAIYKPARGASPRNTPRKRQAEFQSEFGSNLQKNELRILACIHGIGNVPSLVKLVESIQSTNKSSLIKLYVMHLMELTERSSSILMVQRTRRNGLPYTNRVRKGDESLDRVSIEFRMYSNQLGQVKVRHMTTISDLPTMHEDICHVAKEKGVNMLILPFHKPSRRCEDGDVEMEDVGPGWRGVNQSVLKYAPCSVAVLVDRGLSGGDGDIRSSSGGVNEIVGPTSGLVVAQRVCVVFFGGADDREALDFGGRMAEQSTFNVTVLRFVGKNVSKNKTVISTSTTTSTIDLASEEELDENAIRVFFMRWKGLAMYVEKEGTNIVERVLEIGRSGEYELVIVGRCSKMVAELSEKQDGAEHEELGQIGNILSTSGYGVKSSVLVIQKHHVDVVPAYYEAAHPVSEKISLGNDGCSSSSKADASLEISNVNSSSV